MIVAQLLHLESEDPEKDISLYVNSPGGVVTAGLAIYDTMQYLRAPVSTICIGQAASMASVLLAAGAKGKRYALPHSRIMIHQGSGGFRGAPQDALIQMKEWETLVALNHQILARHTGQPLEKGTYGLHMIPGENQWTVIFSKASTAWGSFSYKQDEDALRVNVKPQTAEAYVPLSFAPGPASPFPPSPAVVLMSGVFKPTKRWAPGLPLVPLAPTAGLLIWRWGDPEALIPAALPTYDPPAWVLDDESPPGDVTELDLPAFDYTAPDFAADRPRMPPMQVFQGVAEHSSRIPPSLWETGGTAEVKGKVSYVDLRQSDRGIDSVVDAVRRGIQQSVGLKRNVDPVVAEPNRIRQGGREHVVLIHRPDLASRLPRVPPSRKRIALQCGLLPQILL